MRNVSDKSCRENCKTHFVSKNFFFENYPVYKIICRNTVEKERQQMRIWRVGITCRTSKATDTIIMLTTTYFCVATMVTRTRLNVTCIRTLSVSLVIYKLFIRHRQPQVHADVQTCDPILQVTGRFASCTGRNT